jgi:hypothetical protein
VSTEDPRVARLQKALAAEGASEAVIIEDPETTERIDAIRNRAAIPPSPERPRRDWGEWTPGRGWERLKEEFPGMVPDLTEEDIRRADAVIVAAASKPAPNPLAHLPAMLEDARAYCLARFYYEPGAYISEEARQQHIDNDARSTTTDTRFAMPWNAGYARGISEGLHQADNAINWGTSCLGCADKLDGLIAERGRGYEEGLAEGRRQAAEALQAEAERLRAGYRSQSEYGIDYVQGFEAAAAHLVGPREPTEQPGGNHGQA